MESGNDRVIRFGSFELWPQGRRLLKDGARLPVGARAFDVLSTLVERRERIVTKGELLDAAWPGVVVEENNLPVQIGQLRKFLGRDTIATVPGRGYRFTAAIANELPADAATTRTTVSAPPRGSAATHPLTKLAGRASAAVRPRSGHRIGSIARDRTPPRERRRRRWDRQELPRAGSGAFTARPLAGRRVDGRVRGARRPAARSPCGRAGARSGAERRSRRRRAGRRDRAAVDAARPRQLRASSRSGGRPRAGDPAKGAERDDRGDDAGAATPAGRAAISGHAAGAPPRTSTKDAREYGAIAMFEGRLRSAARHFAITDASLALVVDICRRLDGLPLAIELAAARAATLGLGPVRDNLDARFRLITGGTRSSLPRHQTLRAALERSYNLLEHDEQAVLRRLGVVSVGSRSSSPNRSLATPGSSHGACLTISPR